MRRLLAWCLALGLAWLGVAGAALHLQAAEGGRGFDTPEAAVEALADAARRADRGTVRELFGVDADALVSADQVQVTNELTAFAAAYDVRHRLVPGGSDTRRVLEVGAEGWPFPVPLVLREGRWGFDGEAGLEELVNRRIGRNELSVLAVVRAFVDAQREYAQRDRDGDGVLEFASRIASTPGNRDGLYWTPELDGEISPLGPLVAEAQALGYRRRRKDAGLQPFHGYYYRVLLRQGRHAAGGRHGYVINGNMIAGFALVAWPADYGHSGIMTFVVNQQGRVFQRDLGPRTGRIASGLREFDPGPGWELSPD